MSEKTAELLERLKAQVATLTTTDRWKRYLAMQSTFHTYSFRNVMLILMQRPDAIRVAGFHAWKDLGRSVKKGERGIAILAPMAIKQAPTADDPDPAARLRFRLVYVFDESQTEGEPLPAPSTLLSGHEDAAAAVWAHLSAFAAARSIPIEVTTQGLSEGANGAWCRTTGKIVIHPALAALQRAKTLAHELGHALLHADSSDCHELPIMEVEAESVAYIVMQHFGVDSGDYSFGYVAAWSQEKDLGAVLNASGARIAGATKAILAHRAAAESGAAGHETITLAA